MLDRRRLEQVDHLPGRLPVERRRRLVGENQARPVDQRAGDRHPLALAARQHPRLIVDAVSKAEPVEDLGAAPAHRVRPFVAELHRHLDVFVGGQRVEQVMHLKDKADIAPDRDEFPRRQPRQIAAEDFDAAFLHRAQGADQGQERRLAGARGTGHHDQLARRNVDPVVEQHLVARHTLAVKVVEPVHHHDRRRCDRRGDWGRHRSRRVGDHRAHQNTAAGSARITRPTAIAAEIRHMPRVRPKLNKAMPRLSRIGSSAMRPIRR